MTYVLPPEDISVEEHLDMLPTEDNCTIYERQLMYYLLKKAYMKISQ